MEGTPGSLRKSLTQASVLSEFRRRFGLGIVCPVFHVFGFRELKLHRIWIQCIAENTASVRVLEKIGMRQEGHLHENEWVKDHWWDTLLYAILEHEVRE